LLGFSNGILVASPRGKCPNLTLLRLFCLFPLH
jgi:hypothetical protein